MSIEVEVVSNELGTCCKQVRFLDQQSWQRFQELVHRAANLWPDAHPEIKEFADRVTDGWVKQPYQELESYKMEKQEN